MGEVSLATAGCLFPGCGWLEIWVGRLGWGVPATAGLGLVSIRLWYPGLLGNFFGHNNVTGA